MLCVTATVSGAAVGDLDITIIRVPTPGGTDRVS